MPLQAFQRNAEPGGYGQYNVRRSVIHDGAEESRHSGASENSRVLDTSHLP